MSFLKNVLDKTIIKSFKLPDTLEERKKLYIFLLTSIILFILVVLSIINFIWLNKSVIIDISKEFTQQENLKTQNQSESINVKIDAYKEYLSGGTRLLVLSETIARSPLSDLGDRGLLGKTLLVPEYPPNINIRALVIMDTGAIVVLDIEGEVPGKICKIGTTFGENKGKITDIDNKGVTWTWLKTKHRTNL
ncbi:MAG: hypothetical protein GXZ13_02385 [Synergistaceae bacterium]|jgi:hypothetical protein|nr:hypothetical protein [Synergistaceae bacterium]